MTSYLSEYIYLPDAPAELRGNENVPPSTSTSSKLHKFFERNLNLDLIGLAEELEDRYKKIENAEVLGVTKINPEDPKGEVFLECASVSTIKWRQYNVFQFHIPELHSLFTAISRMVQEACKYYEIDFNEQQFMVQGWFNINEKGNGHLGWHEHGEGGAPSFHGYYCVNAEPSVTLYNVFGKRVEVVNKNNVAILSEVGHPHRQLEWDWDGRRISIAYDIVPLADIIANKHKQEYEQHWIPLA